MSSAVQPILLFGPYQVMTNPEGRPCEMGRGSFGTVYQARHRDSKARVALKELHDRFSADEAVRRKFREEAREHGRLQFPGVVRILDVGETDNSLYIAMDLCLGGDLHGWIGSHGPVPLAKALKILRPVADALVYASGHGLVHRDLKPSNLLVVASPAPGEIPDIKLADFGLAKKVWTDLGGSLANSQSSGIQGTLQYASPEQVLEKVLDTRSDVFSFGMTLWHLLHGGYPFPEQALFVFMKERAEMDTYESRYPASWPPYLREFMSRMVVGDKERRFPDFGRLVAALDRCLEQEEANTFTTPAPAPAPAIPAKPPLQGTEALPVREFFTLQPLEKNILGTLYEANPVAGGKACQLQMLKRELDPELYGTVIKAAEALEAQPHPSLVGIEQQKFRDGTVLIFGVPAGAPTLLESIRKQGARRASEILPWLEQLACGFDHAAALSLPGVESAPASVVLIPHEAGTGHRPVLMPRLHLEEQVVGGLSEGPELTPTTPAAGFSRLAYWLLAAHEPKQAAFATSTAYAATGSLSEAGNSLLREALCGQSAGRCVDLLAALANAEGLAYAAPVLPGVPVPSAPPQSFVPPVTVPAPPSVPITPSTGFVAPAAESQEMSGASIPAPAPFDSSPGSINAGMAQLFADALKQNELARQQAETARLEAEAAAKQQAEDLKLQQKKNAEIQAQLELQAKEKEALHKQNQRLAADKAKLESQIGSLESKVSVLNEEKKQAEADKLHLEADVTSLLTQKRDLTARQRALDLELAEKQVEIEQVRARRVSSEAGSGDSASSEALAILEADFWKLQQARSSGESALNGLQQDIDAKNAELEKARADIHLLEQDKARQEQTITDLLAQAGGHSAELAQEVEKRRLLEAQMAEIQQKYQTAVAAANTHAATAADEAKQARDAAQKLNEERVEALEKKTREAEESRKKLLKDVERLEEEKRRNAAKIIPLSGEAPTKRHSKFRTTRRLALATLLIGLSWAGWKVSRPVPWEEGIVDTLFTRKVKIEGLTGSVTIRAKDDVLWTITDKDTSNSKAEFRIRATRKTSYNDTKAILTITDGGAAAFDIAIPTNTDAEFLYTAPSNVKFNILAGADDETLKLEKRELELIFEPKNGGGSASYIAAAGLPLSIRLPKGPHLVSWQIRGRASKQKFPVLLDWETMSPMEIDPVVNDPIHVNLTRPRLPERLPVYAVDGTTQLVLYHGDNTENVGDWPMQVFGLLHPMKLGEMTGASNYVTCGENWYQILAFGILTDHIEKTKLVSFSSSLNNLGPPGLAKLRKVVELNKMAEADPKLAGQIINILPKASNEVTTQAEKFLEVLNHYMLRNADFKKLLIDYMDLLSPLADEKWPPIKTPNVFTPFGVMNNKKLLQSGDASIMGVDRVGDIIMEIKTNYEGLFVVKLGKNPLIKEKQPWVYPDGNLQLMTSNKSGTVKIAHHLKKLIPLNTSP